MTSWNSYPKIYNVGHPAIKDLLLDEISITEKADGSQISFGKFDSELKVKSKSQQLIVDAPEKMFIKAVETAKELFPLLRDGWTYRGEYLQKPKHNALSYDRVPKKNIILFDINTAEETYLAYDDMKAEAEKLGLEVVPQLFQGKIERLYEYKISNESEQKMQPKMIWAVKQLLDTVSILGGQKIEGIVIKNYSRFGKDGKALMGKHVSEAFKEVHANEWKKSNPGKNDVIQSLIEYYKTPARWNKAVQHLKERGLLTNSPRDIGPLIKETQKDIEEECQEEIKERLYKWAEGQISRGVTGGLPEWYKQKLLESQFEE